MLYKVICSRKNSLCRVIVIKIHKHKSVFAAINLTHYIPFSFLGLYEAEEVQ